MDSQHLTELDDVGGAQPLTVSSQFVSKHASWLFGAILFAGFAIILWHLSRTTTALIESSAVRDADRYTDALSELRTLYTAEVVTVAREFGMEVTHDYQTKEHSIPLPATLSMELGNRLGRKDSGVSTRLYSDYPFAWNKEGGPQDEFEREALKFLRLNPKEAFYRFEKQDGESVLRYATADIMLDSCISCHNSHKDSPKTDWQVGDVRGVLGITLPLRGVVAETRSQMSTTFGLMMLFGAAVVAVFGGILARLQRNASTIDAQNASLVAKQQELIAARARAECANEEVRANAAQIERARRAAVNLMKDTQAAKRAADIASEAKGNFLANMSHEIRTPMTAILGFIDILTDPKASALEQSEAASTVRRSGRHLLNLINDILDLSKIEAGHLEIEQMSVDLPELLCDLRDMFEGAAQAKGLSLEFGLAGPIPKTILSDPTRLKQALTNMIGNAIKFTHQGRVRVITSCDRPAHLLAIQVVDSGIGMTQQQQAAVFEPFSQGDTSTTRKYGGTGLGLTITKQIAELLGGSIAVHARPNKGSVFTIEITVGDLEDCELVTSLAERTRTGASSKRLSGKFLADSRVLLVEDGPDNQRLISFVLTKAGASVDLAENGSVAVNKALAALADDSPYDLILMDMQMPVMDGYAATAYLREQGYSDLIVALTAHAMSGDSSPCFEAGCDGYLTKPIDREHFLAAVKSYIEGSRSEMLISTV